MTKPARILIIVLLVLLLFILFDWSGGSYIVVIKSLVRNVLRRVL